MTVVEWMSVLTPVLALAFNCIGYLFVRRGLGAGVAVSVLTGLLFGLAGIIMLTLAVGLHGLLDPWDLWISGIGAYLALSFCFWAFLNLNITSLRIRVLRDLLAANGSAAVSDVLASYPDEERLQRRLRRLTSGGQIVLVDGRWRLKSRVLLVIARVLEVVRGIMGLG